ncbi:MAG: MBL fold metallo-hydrolase [Synergistaceae bacterium]|nr:MBL fold metallo-hydrolase [Synergistaceae bacterium]
MPYRTTNTDNFIRFLGTAGTRFIMLSQRRSSGGIWFSYGSARGVIDPGPGSLVRICEAGPPLSPMDINAIIVTHRHIDHSSDVNALAEGMTLMARAPKGLVLLTRDCMENGDGVLMRYLCGKIKSIAFHEDGAAVSLSDGTTVESVAHSHHGVQCYGLIFRKDSLPAWGVISDTAPLPHFTERYAECELLVINTTLMYPRARLDHMAVTDVESLLEFLRPKTAVLTHMGNDLLDRGGEYISKQLSSERTKVIAAVDGLTLNLEEQPGNR